jgi:hypothetical protein
MFIIVKEVVDALLLVSVVISRRCDGGSLDDAEDGAVIDDMYKKDRVGLVVVFITENASTVYPLVDVVLDDNDDCSSCKHITVTNIINIDERPLKGLDGRC